jgi:nuclear transcription factor Y, gamma
MVQAAAQAQAVVSAAKSRGDGLVPMNAQQIQALSQIQAQAIVNARPQTALLASGGPTTDKDGKPIQPTQAQIQHQITLQAQALVHAHTQAQIAAGIYKGDGSAKGTTKPAVSTATKPATTNAMSSTESVSTLTPNQLAQQTNLSSRHDSTKKEMIQKHESQLINLRSQFQQANLAAAPSQETQSEQESQIKTMIDRHKQELANLEKSMQVEMAELQAEFRKQNSAVDATGQKSVALSGAAVNRTAVPPKLVTSVASTPSNIALSTSLLNDEPVASSTSPVFLEKLSNTLNNFWTEQLQQMRELGTAIPQTEQDFKNHNDLPLARIKRIMKSDEDVRMISAEAPVLFAKACEMFILELTLRSWSYSENNKRRTLQKEDIREAIQRTDIFDFLVDLPNSTM